MSSNNNNTVQIINEIIPLLTAVAGLLPSAISVIKSIQSGQEVSAADLATYQQQRQAAYTAMVNALLSNPPSV